jgi:hypothetical protein
MLTIIRHLNHYVYAYLRKKSFTPYYIGKGTKRRAWSKHSKYIPVPTENYRIVIIAKDLTEIGALALERRLIRWYGRKDLGTGYLINRTDGGEGTTGISLATRMRISQAVRKSNRTTVKGRLWWNDGNRSVRAVNSPGTRWSLGMLEEPWNKGIEIGYSWYNGREYRVSLNCPGPGWTKQGATKGKPRPRESDSRSNHKGTCWWHNGDERRRSSECPGPEWKRGTGVVTIGSTGKSWYNNGKESRLFLTNPGEGWNKGRLP